MDTPYLPQSLFAEEFKKVYEPAEDTFLLLDALEKDLDTLTKHTLVCLECGSGSGTVITALAKVFENKPCLLLATDINPDACRTTRKCLKFHDQNKVDIIQADLALPLVDRLCGKVDLLVFNPPYVPTVDEEMSRSKFSTDQLNLSWAGGSLGRKVTDRFLITTVPQLMSKPHGRSYIVALDKNDVEQLTDCLLAKHKIKGRVILHREAGIESLSVIRYEWIVD